MRRQFIILFAAIVLGAATTVAIAWGLAWWARGFPDGYELGFVHDSGETWYIRHYEMTGSRKVVGVPVPEWSAAGRTTDTAAFLGRWSAFNQPPKPGESSDDAMTEYGHGWPVIAFACSLGEFGRAYARGPGRPPAPPSVQSGLSITGDEVLPVLDGHVLDDRWEALWRASATLAGGQAVPYEIPILPLRMYWGGFLLDVLFWWLVWFVTINLLVEIVLLPGRIRRSVRRRRGRCQHCGYDLRGCEESGCPECGQGRAVSEQRSET